MDANGRTRWMLIAIGVIVCYVLIAYIIVPLGWETFARTHPSFDDDPRITQTGDGHPGDPLNVALIGTRSEVEAILQAGEWYPAAALGLKSDIEIAADTVLSRPDREAPVSNLYLFGRKEDLAFEKAVGDSPRKRHHVRFWTTGEVDEDGRPIWIGSASYDERVGWSHTTGQITHHIAADVDAERDYFMSTLDGTGRLSEVFGIDDFHAVHEGRNGGGDRWHTDGRLLVGDIRAAAVVGNGGADAR